MQRALLFTLTTNSTNALADYEPSSSTGEHSQERCKAEIQTGGMLLTLPDTCIQDFYLLCRRDFASVSLLLLLRLRPP